MWSLDWDGYDIWPEGCEALTARVTNASVDQSIAFLVAELTANRLAFSVGMGIMEVVITVADVVQAVIHAADQGSEILCMGRILGGGVEPAHMVGHFPEGGFLFFPGVVDAI